MSIKKRQKRSALLAYIILAVGAVFMIIPFLWMVLTSFKTYRETVKLPIQWFPAEWNFDNYVEVLKQLDFLRYYRNTILVTVTTLVAMTLIASLAAYAFARMEFPGKNVIFAYCWLFIWFRLRMTMIPKYMMITKLGWVDTLAGIVVPNIFSVYTMFMLRQFFVSVPKELDEAAKLDGCSFFGIFWRVDLPLIRNGLIAITVLNLLWSWNDLLWPLIATSTDKMRVLSVAIATLNNSDGSQYQLLMAAGVLAVLPMLVIYAICQEYFMDGIMSSGVKG